MVPHGLTMASHDSTSILRGTPMTNIRATFHYGDDVAVRYFNLGDLTEAAVRGMISDMPGLGPHSNMTAAVPHVLADLAVGVDTDWGWVRFEHVIRQDRDGTPHFSYYVAPWSFVWDGYESKVQVCHGGAGEPVVAEIRAPHDRNPLTFAETCDANLYDLENGE